jgi:2-polyprenyl-3-methyl-5-hydroxy-6-metoxy-1,4-benzoquinol methylase
MEKLDYSRHYLNWHSDSEEHRTKIISYYKNNILKFFPKEKNMEILDIGCGMGFLLCALKEAGYTNLTGIDLDESQVNSAKNKGLIVELISDTESFLDQNQNKYEIICLFDVLEHIKPEAQINFISKIYKSLRQDGILIGSVPNANSILGSRNRYIDYTHHVAFTEISLDFVLYSGGFKKITLSEMDFVGFKLSPVKFIRWILFKLIRFFRRIVFLAELGKDGLRIPLSFNLLFTAKK